MIADLHPYLPDPPGNLGGTCIQLEGRVSGCRHATQIILCQLKAKVPIDSGAAVSVYPKAMYKESTLNPTSKVQLEAVYKQKLPTYAQCKILSFVGTSGDFFSKGSNEK